VCRSPVGYGLWTARAGFQLGCERFGAMAVPVGPGNLEWHDTEIWRTSRPRFSAAPLPWPAHGRGVKRRDFATGIRLRKVIFGAERHSEAMRR